MKIAQDITVASLEKKALRVFQVSAAKVETLDRRWNPASGSPVYTVQGQYTSRGWTEWTQGYQFGSAVLQFDVMGDEQFLEIGRIHTVSRMPKHVSHIGVHDHGFNNLEHLR